MVRANRALIALSAASLLAFGGTAAATRYPNDITSWPLSGLRLGMSPDDALRVALAGHLLGEHPYVGKAPCESERLPLIRSRKIAAGAPLTSFAYGGSCTQLIGTSVAEVGRLPGYRATLGFTEDLPSRPGVMRLTYIALFGPNASDADRAAFMQKVIARYGQPTRHVAAGLGMFERAPWTTTNGIAYESRSTGNIVTLPIESNQGYTGRLKIMPSNEVALVAFSAYDQNTVVLFDGPTMLRSQRVSLANEEAVQPTNAAPI